jgi:hypothetical protein
MKHLNEYIKESLLDVDDFDLDRTIKIENIKKFIDENYEIESYTISKKPNKDGKYVVDSNGSIAVENEKITNLTNDLFVWGEVGGSFYCYCCGSLTSLNGAPEKVGGMFECYRCKSLTSLKGAPKEVGKSFVCHNCKSLTSLNGAPEKVGGDFDCYRCKTQFTEDDVRKVTNVRGKIYC